MRALIPELNSVVLGLAPQYTARPQAPETFQELMRAEQLTVWDGASDRTIWGDARVNHAFRAWHDARHIDGLCAFDPEGEARACEMQCRDILAAYPRAPKLWLDAIRAEVNGQVQFYVNTGAFPSDQVALVLSILRSHGHNIGV
jgi:hypothetical protein